MKYLLDTNLCIYLINSRSKQLIERFKAEKVGDIGLSSITLAELQYGVAKSDKKNQNRKALNQFLTPLEVVMFDDIAAESYGDIRVDLQNKGTPIGPMDLLIAAHAISQQWILVTNNEKEFRRIPHLKVENWILEKVKTS